MIELIFSYFILSQNIMNSGGEVQGELCQQLHIIDTLQNPKPVYEEAEKRFKNSAVKLELFNAWYENLDTCRVEEE